MTLTPSQIEVLARFDGWDWYFNVMAIVGKDGDDIAKQRVIKHAIKHITSPGVLIEMRLKIIERVKMLGRSQELYTPLFQLKDLILSGEYTAAAIKTSELIQKLEA
jgi:hypothetical protein